MEEVSDNAREEGKDYAIAEQNIRKDRFITEKTRQPNGANWPERVVSLWINDFLTSEGQGASITLIIYPTYRSKKYGRGLTNITILYSKHPMAYERKMKRVVSIELL